MPMDIYCERLNIGFWAEPFNAISNISFFLAAWFAWRLARDKKCTNSFEVWALISLITIIGIGSFLFHTLALRWTMYADMIPIFVYQSLFLTFYMLKVARFSPLVAAYYFVVFVIASHEVNMMRVDWLNGSVTYAIALLFIVGMGIYHWWTNKKAPYTLLVASGIFIVSLTFRSLDFAVCEYVSIGTHLIWHILIGVVLYLTASAYIANLPSSSK